MDLTSNPKKIQLTAPPKLSQRVSNRGYVVGITALATGLLVIVSGLAWAVIQHYIPASQDPPKTAAHVDTSASGETEASSIVQRMSNETTTKTPPTAPPVSMVPNLNNAASKPLTEVAEEKYRQWTNPSAEQTAAGSTEPKLTPQQQYALDRYQNLLKARETPLGVATTTPAGWNPAGMQTPDAGLIPTIPTPQQTVDAPPIGLPTHAKPDEEAILVQPPPGALQIAVGTLITVRLGARATSDVAGDLLGRVTLDVYDTHDGKRHLLLPVGTLVVGSSDMRVPYGQSRMVQVWNQIRYADGRTIKLGDLNGADTDGSAGVKDRVNNHYGRMIRDGALLTAFAAAVGLTQRNQSLLTTQSVGGSIGQSVGQQIGEIGSEMTNRNLNIPPTVEATPGKTIQIVVNRAIVFLSDPFPGRG